MIQRGCASINENRGLRNGLFMSMSARWDARGRLTRSQTLGCTSGKGGRQGSRAVCYSCWRLGAGRRRAESVQPPPASCPHPSHSPLPAQAAAAPFAAGVSGNALGGWLAGGWHGIMPATCNAVPCQHAHTPLHLPCSDFPAATTIQQGSTPPVRAHQTLHWRLLRLLPPRGSRCCCAATASRGALLLPLPEQAKHTVPPLPAHAGHGCGSFCGWAKNGRQVCVPSCHGGGHQHGAPAAPAHTSHALVLLHPRVPQRSQLACEKPMRSAATLAVATALPTITSWRMDGSATAWQASERRLAAAACRLCWRPPARAVPGPAAAVISMLSCEWAAAEHRRVRPLWCWRVWRSPAACRAGRATVHKRCHNARSLEALSWRRWPQHEHSSGPCSPTSCRAAGSSADNTGKSIDVQGRGAGTASSTYHPL